MKWNKKYIIFIMLFFLGFSNLCAEEKNYYQEGVNRYLDGNIEEAQVLLKQAYDQNPSSKEIKGLYVETLILISGKYYKTADFKKAFEYIKQAKALKPADDKIINVYKMLYEKLNPGKYDIKQPSIVENEFKDIQKRTEEKRVKRVKIVKTPPLKITVKERELIRPIFMDSSVPEKNTNSYLLAGLLLVFFIFILVILFLIKQMMQMNQNNMVEMARSSENKIDKLQKELNKVKKKEQDLEKERLQDEEQRRKELEIMENQLRKKYAAKKRPDAKESASSVRVVPEPVLEVVSFSPEDESARERLKTEFQQLKKENYPASVKLLKELTTHKNSWYRLWVTVFVAELKIDDSIELLKILVTDKEYQIKKAALKVLKYIRDEASPSVQQKEYISGIIRLSLKDGWVV